MVRAFRPACHLSSLHIDLDAAADAQAQRATKLPGPLESQPLRPAQGDRRLHLFQAFPLGAQHLGQRAEVLHHARGQILEEREELEADAGPEKAWVPVARILGVRQAMSAEVRQHVAAPRQQQGADELGRGARPVSPRREDRKAPRRTPDQER